MKKHILSLAPCAVLAVFLATLAACGGNAAPVASVEVTPKAFRLGFPDLREVHLKWSPVEGLGDSAKPIVFVHLLDDQDEVMRTFDHPFPKRWAEGEPVEYDLKVYQSALGQPLPAGKYRLTLGLYQEGGKRWALDGLGKPFKKREYVVAEVEVPPAGQGGPLIAFSSESWLPLQPGGDRQVLARRWMSGTAALRIQNIAAPGKAWMVVRIPEPSSVETIQVEAGSNAPAVLVSSSCGSVEVNLTGSGSHDVEIPIDAVPAGGSCDVILKPNFRINEVGVAVQRSASLESIAWAPAGSLAQPDV
ncbi:MAG TPA: hypothetical protein VHU81_02450, partial [Thermoanaerobaculia bacterium]|nr:hypothetical protein [Thermoanaerobaculia bacterium]